MLAQTAWAGRPFSWRRGVWARGSRGEKCFIRRSGPTVLMRKLSRAWRASIWEGDFSA
jgi:hypothetical protein